MWHTVEEGQTLSSIAEQYGLGGWRDIYDAPENEEFRKLRPDPDLIRPGDMLCVPLPDDEDDEDLGVGTDLWWDDDEGAYGLSGMEADEDEDEEEEVPDEPPDMADDEDEATSVHPVCRNLFNTIDTRPEGFHWFSA